MNCGGIVCWFVKILGKESRYCSHLPQERSFTHRPSHQFLKMEITLLSGGADDTGRLAAVDENSVPGARALTAVTLAEFQLCGCAVLRSEHESSIIAHLLEELICGGQRTRWSWPPSSSFTWVPGILPIHVLQISSP